MGLCCAVSCAEIAAALPAFGSRSDQRNGPPAMAAIDVEVGIQRQHGAGLVQFAHADQDRLASEEWWRQLFELSGDPVMRPFAPIQRRDQWAGVEQHDLTGHFPKSSM